MSLDPPIGLNQNTDVITVGDFEYDQPLRPYLRFMNRDNETHYLYDSFRTTNDFNLNSLQTENGIGETGSATIVIEDSSRDLDPNLISWGNKVIIKIAKNQSDFTGNPESTFLIGYVKGYKKSRPATNILEHHIQVLGSKVLFSDRKIYYKKATDASNPSSAYQIKNHIKTIISDPSAYPIKVQTLQQQGKFDLSGISSELKTPVSKVNYELIEAGGAIERLASIEGARFFIDYVGDSEIVKVVFPNDLHTGVVVKSGDLKAVTDPALYSSYFMGHWEGEGDITGSSGFANRLWTKTQIAQKEFTSSFVNAGSMSLTNKAIAQKFFITETRITDLAFLLSMVGEVTSQNNRVNGAIIADNGNSPTGNVISTFNIPLSSIEYTTQTIYGLSSIFYTA